MVFDPAPCFTRELQMGLSSAYGDLRKFPRHFMRNSLSDSTTHRFVVGSPSWKAPRAAPREVVIVKKRKRDEENVLFRMLACIPTISEAVARALVDRFDTLPALQMALRADDFPRVPFGNGEHCIGQARIATLRKTLL